MSLPGDLYPACLLATLPIGAISLGLLFGPSGKVTTFHESQSAIHLGPEAFEARGGVWCGRARASWPGPSISFDTEMLQIVTRSGMMPYCLYVSRSEVDGLVIRRGLSAWRVEIVTNGQRSTGVVFFVFNRASVERAAGRLGWLVM